jgi:diguanylate cyclase (GGDEF)-like protein
VGGPRALTVIPPRPGTVVVHIKNRFALGEDRLLRWWDCSAASGPDQSAPIGDPADLRDADHGYGRYDEWYDPVTGLPRPRCFLEHLERLLATADGCKRSVAMLLLEVANLDLLEAQHGEPCCDELLRTIAERLHEEVPEPSLMTRLHGGRFAIVLHDLGPGVAPDAVATHLLERAGEPCPSGDGHVRCAVVGGLAVPADQAEQALQLFDRATRALARAKLQQGQPWQA